MVSIVKQFQNLKNPLCPEQVSYILITDFGCFLQRTVVFMSIKNSRYILTFCFL